MSDSKILWSAIIRGATICETQRQFRVKESPIWLVANRLWLLGLDRVAIHNLCGRKVDVRIQLYLQGNVIRYRGYIIGDAK